MSNGKREDGAGPSTSVTVPGSTIIQQASSTPIGVPSNIVSELSSIQPTELPFSVFPGLPDSILTALPSSIPLLISGSVKPISVSSSSRGGAFTATEAVTVFTGQSTPSIFITSITVATTISVTPNPASSATGSSSAISQSQFVEISLLHKTIITVSVLGGVIILLLIGLAIAYCLYKRRRERRIRQHLGFDPSESPPLTSLAPLPSTSLGQSRHAGTHLSTGPRSSSGLGIGIASTMGGAIGSAYNRDTHGSGGEQESSASINTFGTHNRNSGPILTRPSPSSSPQGSPPRSPARPPRPEREVHFAHVPAIAITPSTPSMRGSTERRFTEGTSTGAAGIPSTPPRAQMRSTHDGSPRFFPLTNFPQASASGAPVIPSFGRPSIGSRRIVSSLYSTDDLGLGNLMPGSGVSERVHETRASSGVFPEPGERDSDEEEDGDGDDGGRQDGDDRRR